MNEDRKVLVRKIIPLIAITGCMGGTTASVMEWTGSGQSYLISGLIILLYAVLGTAAGHLAVVFFDKRGQDIVARNEKDELLLVKQPAYLVSGAAVIIAFIMNVSSGIGIGLLAALFYGGAFLLGVSNGLFDYKESVTKNLMMLPVVPIGFSFIYGYYINGSDTASTMAWLFGSVYLFSYLLFLNRMQLNSIIFFRKSVNIEDSKKIRMYNDWLIILFYMVYLVMFNFRKLLKVSYDAILAVFGVLLVIMEKISDWLIADIDKKGASELPLESETPDFLPDIRRPWLETLLKVMMYVIVSAVAIAAVVSIIIIIIRTIKKIREKLSSRINTSRKQNNIEYVEYEEETEIVKDQENKDNLRSRRKKMKYNLKNLNDIPLTREKIRYVYGLVLERLYYKQVDISESDTPDEILGKIKRNKNGDKLAKIGFDEFTEKYKKARYSDKEIKEDAELTEKGSKFEKAVTAIQVDKADTKL